MLRSIQKSYEIIKMQDPDTAVTAYTIRQWCKEGKVASIKTGNKVLVDIQSLMDFINIKETKEN